MLRPRATGCSIVLVGALLELAVMARVGVGQTAAAVVVDDSERVELRGSVAPRMRGAEDQGAVAPELAADRMIVMLQRPAAQEAALQRFLEAVQDRSSPLYHRFLSPKEFGESFGPPQSVVDAVTAWLQGQGFRVDRVAAGRNAIVFSGNAGQVERAFHTAIHRYAANGEVHYANAGEPEIPAALAGVVKGIGLNNFGPRALNRQMGRVELDRSTGQARPLYNEPEQDFSCLSGYCFAVTPGDWATIYDAKPLLAVGIDGSGVTIGVVGRAPIDTPSVQDFRRNFLPAYSATNLPNLILDGATPTEFGSDDVTESYLDVEMAGAVAPNATVDYYYAASSYVADGVDLAIARAIEDNQVSILSISYGECEAEAGDLWDSFYNGLYEQAAAQGITVLAAAGDSGSAGCDPPPGVYGESAAIDGLAVSALASTPYNVAVGGTDFYYPANATLATLGTYWNLPTATDPNNNPDWSSVKGYIPEKPWDVSTVPLNQVAKYTGLGAGGGGKSSCVVSTGSSPAVCQSGYAKPAWQSGFGSDAVRDLPDVSLFASSGGNYSFTAMCLPGSCEATGGGPESVDAPLMVVSIGGTSVAAPLMASILALVEQKTQTRLGLANPMLYALSKQTPTAFHDISVGTNSVQCKAGSPDCGADGYLAGYNAGPGYDLATGLGSVDVAVLANSWAGVVQAAAATTTTLSITPSTAVHGTALTFVVNVTGGATSGSIALMRTAAGGAAQGQYATNCAAFPCTFTYAGLPGGSYQVSARFAGNSSYAASTSAGVPVTITPESSQIGVYAQVGDVLSNGGGTQVFNLNGETLVYGGIVTFTSVPLPASAPIPANPFVLTSTPATGTITVSDNGTPVGAPLVLDGQGNALFEDYLLPAGKHSLVAAYSGDASYGPSTTVAPLATPLNFTIAQSASSIVLEPPQQAVAQGSSAMLTAVVNGVPFFVSTLSGTVTFTVTSGTGIVTVLPAVPVSVATDSAQTQAVVTIPASALTAGTNTVTASYSGDGNFLGSATGAAGVATIMVGPANTTLTLTATPAATVFGQSTTLTATLSRMAGSKATGDPSGTILVTDGGNFLAQFFVPSSVSSPGVYIDSTPALAVGTHTLTAVYSGDAQNTGATASTMVVVTAGPLDFKVAGTGVTFLAGTSGAAATSTLTVTLNAAQSSASSVGLSCAVAAHVPIGCVVAPSVSVGPGSVAATTDVTLTLLATVAEVRRGGPSTWRGMVALACLAPLWMVARRRRWRPVAGAALLLVLTMGLSACGSDRFAAVTGGGSEGLEPGTYAVVVTASMGSVTHQANILVTVP